jgi:hypothetical protein
MAASNQLSITFSNMLPSSFEFAKSDGWPAPDMSQDMMISRGLSSPLSGQNQTLLIAQEQTFVDSLKNQSIVGSAIANPSGCVSTSVVWTNYTIGIRFGINASIQVSRFQSVETVLSHALSYVMDTDPPDPTLVWQYMLDNAPDKPVNWSSPPGLANPVSVNCPGSPQYQLVINPTVSSNSLDIQCQIQQSS